MKILLLVGVYFIVQSICYAGEHAVKYHDLAKVRAFINDSALPAAAKTSGLDLKGNQVDESQRFDISAPVFNQEFGNPKYCCKLGSWILEFGYFQQDLKNLSKGFFGSSLALSPFDLRRLILRVRNNGIEEEITVVVNNNQMNPVYDLFDEHGAVRTGGNVITGYKPSDKKDVYAVDHVELLPAAKNEQATAKDGGEPKKANCGD